MTDISLKYLKEQTCSIEELQKAIVCLIELHNKLATDIHEMIKDGRIRSKREVSDTMRFNL